MARTWVLDTETKGTGANVVPLERAQQKPDAPADKPEPRRHKRNRPATDRERRRTAKPAQPAERTATALPPGHVRKRSTGEIGRVKAVDAKAGTATVHWLKRGAASTVPLSTISRH